MSAKTMTQEEIKDEVDRMFRVAEELLVPFVKELDLKMSIAKELRNERTEDDYKSGISVSLHNKKKGAGARCLALVYPQVGDNIYNEVDSAKYQVKISLSHEPETCPTCGQEVHA